MPNPRLPLLAVALLAVVACTPTAAPPGSPGSTGNPGSPSPSTVPPGGIEHPTGPTDIVLRYEEGGGMGMAEHNVTQVPIFTLYGDGTILFRDPAAQPQADENFFLRFTPLKTARLSGEQIQELLDFAINRGGLGVARANYPNDLLADAGTATFTLRAGGLEKVVSIYGLVETGAEGQDALARQAFLALAERLRNFDGGGTYPTTPYEPPAYRAILMGPQDVIAQTRAWPWPNLKPSDFAAPGDPNAPTGFPQRVLSPAEVEAIGLGDLHGGALGIFLTGPDGKKYSLALRPLLPGEVA